LPRPTRPVLEELGARIGWALPALAALALGIVRLPELTRSPLWYDELFSVGVAGLPFADAMRRIVADHTNPPLFYLILKVWIAIGGDGDHWVRLLPCLFAMMLGAGLVWLAREARAGAIAGALAVAFAAASPLSVDLANEVRAYSLLALLACLSLAATLRDRTRRTDDSFALLTIINVALVHTHYFGWLTVAAECLAAVVWSRAFGVRILRSAGLTVVAFLPWATAVAAHALSHPAPLRNVGWITQPDAAAPLWLVRDLTGRSGSAIADIAWLAVVGVALAATTLRAWRERVARSAASRSTDATASTVNVSATGATPARGAITLLAVAGLAMPLTVWAFSLLSGHSLWVQRYLLGAAAPVAMLVAIAIAALPPRRWHVAAVAGFVWAAIALAALPRRAPTKVDWIRFARRLDTAIGSPRDVFALEAFTAAPLQRYARPGQQVRIVTALDELPSGDVWLVYRPESFAAGSPSGALSALRFSTVTALSTETAGQKIVAVRIRRDR
jgi:uncharacterized membrane protein